MKKQLLFFLLILIHSCFTLEAKKRTVHDDSLHVHVAATEYARMNIKVLRIGADPDLASILPVLKKDLMFSGQFDVAHDMLDAVPSSSFFGALAQEGYPFVIVLEKKDTDIITWRLYDATCTKMVAGKSYTKHGDCVRGWAHEIGDALWPALTGQQGFFSTKIAYCKPVHVDHKKTDFRHICIADYDGSNEQLLVDTPTINLAPRWNKDVKRPLLFYSEYTDKNIRLMSIDMHKHRHIASNFDGINMLPSFSGDGKRVVYCASRADGNCHLYYFEKGTFKRLLGAQGNHVSPSISADGSYMYFCSDFENRRPRIYRYDFDTQTVTCITQKGTGMAPNYSSVAGKVVYTKFVQGVVQLFSYEEATGMHTQLTFDNSNKDEASWSPCGNYLLFSVEKGGKSRIAQLNLLTTERRYLTPAAVDCTYPIWSGRYEHFPVIS